MALRNGHMLETPDHGYSATDRPTWYITNGWGRRWGINWGGNQDHFLRGWGFGWGLDWGSTTKTGWRSRTGTGYADAASVEAGTYTDNRPIVQRGYAFDGDLLGRFVDDFYNRILQEPVLLEFGQVATEQSLDFTVWNAFFVSKTLVSVTETAFDSGTTFSGQATPSVFGALEERTYQITVVPDGPPTIDAEITFVWQVGIDSTSTAITGSRVLLLPIVFSDETQESLEWKTDVLDSWNGTEQRIRQRLAPRQQLSVRAYLPRSQMHSVDNLLYRAREEIWVMAMWIESRSGDSAITAGDTVLNVDTRYGDFREDALAIVWESPAKYDVFQISAKTDSTLTSTSVMSNSYSAPLIMPVRSVRITGNPIRTTSGYNAELSLNVEVVDNVVLPTSPSAQQFLSTDTWFEEPLASSDRGAPDTYVHRIEVIDSETGAVQIFAPWDDIQVGRTVEFLFEGQQAIWEFREWLHRRAGQLVPFYMPTFENNFNLISTGVIGTSFDATDYSYDYDLSGRDHIVFKLSDGTWEPRTITASSESGGVVTVNFTPVLNEDAADIEEIGFFGQKRLGMDRVTMTWLPNNVLSVTMTILEIAP